MRESTRKWTLGHGSSGSRALPRVLRALVHLHLRLTLPSLSAALSRPRPDSGCRRARALRRSCGIGSSRQDRCSHASERLRRPHQPGRLQHLQPKRRKCSCAQHERCRGMRRQRGRACRLSEILHHRLGPLCTRRLNVRRHECEAKQGSDSPPRRQQTHAYGNNNKCT